MILCNKKTGEYGPLIPLAEQISLKSDRLLDQPGQDTRDGNAAPRECGTTNTEETARRTRLPLPQATEMVVCDGKHHAEHPVPGFARR